MRLLTNEQEDKIREDGGPSSKCILAIYIGDIQLTTCYRQSSCYDYPTWFYETFVWRTYEEPGKDRDLIGDVTGSDPFEVARRILQEGWPLKEVEDEE